MSLDQLVKNVVKPWLPARVYTLIADGFASLNAGLQVSGNTKTDTAQVTTKLTTAGFQLTASPTSGYVLTSDASGNGTWQAGGGGVSSVASDATIKVNGSASAGPTTGAITLGASGVFGTTAITQSSGSFTQSGTGGISTGGGVTASFVSVGASGGGITSTGGCNLSGGNTLQGGTTISGAITGDEIASASVAYSSTMSVTSNGNCGVITITSVSQAASAGATLTVTNDTMTETSVIMLTLNTSGITHNTTTISLGTVGENTFNVQLANQSPR